MARRKFELVTEEYYHVFSKSIADFIIFKQPGEYERFLQLLGFFRYQDIPYKFITFLGLKDTVQSGYGPTLAQLTEDKGTIVDILAYCLMPTHIHLFLRQTADHGISKFMGNVLNSYSRYFNVKHKRLGPLWAGRFKNILVKTDEQLLHLTRYIHLNPTSAGLVQKPEHWQYSSYANYTDPETPRGFLTDHKHLIDMKPEAYKQFTENRIEDQRTLAILKHALFD